MTGGSILKGKFRQSSPDTPCTFLNFFQVGKTCWDFSRIGWGGGGKDQVKWPNTFKKVAEPQKWWFLK